MPQFKFKRSMIRCLAAALLMSVLIPYALQAGVLTIVPGPQEETIILQIPNAKQHKLFTLQNPDRLVIDVPKLEHSTDIQLPSAYDGDLVKKVRTGLFTANTTRIVFDLSDTINITKVRPSSDELTIQIEREHPSRSSGFLSKLEPPRVPDQHSGKDIIDDHYIPPSRPKGSFEPPKRETPSKPVAQVKKTQRPSYVKRTPEKPMIVIDPGHGGQDPGTTGKRGSVEKDVVLDYAMELEKKLESTGRYRVKLTRRNDQYIMLRERIALARKHGADLFISLHADSAPGEARGLSIYTVSEKASDEEAQALAARENKSDVLAGIDLQNEREDVADILISLAERDTKNRSATLADMVVLAMKGKVDLLPEPHRFAGFAVLKAPDVPSVLIEIGFLSHQAEEKQITSSSHRKKVVAKIADAIDNYFRKESTLWIP